MRQMVERVRGALIECADKMHDMFHSIKTADALYEVSVTPWNICRRVPAYNQYSWDFVIMDTSAFMVNVTLLHFVWNINRLN